MDCTANQSVNDCICSAETSLGTAKYKGENDCTKYKRMGVLTSIQLTGDDEISTCLERQPASDERIKRSKFGDSVHQVGRK